MNKLEDLVTAARSAAQHSYSPYSNFKVASAVEMEDGTIFSASNVENASYGLTCCAERNAIFQAVSKGHRLIKRIVIYAPSPTVRTGPCGACRQVIKEFADENTLIIGACDSDDILTFTMEDLLPKSFGPDNLLKKRNQ
jgi:cytidine deaminase